MSETTDQTPEAPVWSQKTRAENAYASYADLIQVAIEPHRPMVVLGDILIPEAGRPELELTGAEKYRFLKTNMKLSIKHYLSVLVTQAEQELEDSGAVFQDGTTGFEQLAEQIGIIGRRARSSQRELADFIWVRPEASLDLVRAMWLRQARPGNYSELTLSELTNDVLSDETFEALYDTSLQEEAFGEQES